LAVSLSLIHHYSVSRCKPLKEQLHSNCLAYTLIRLFLCPLILIMLLKRQLPGYISWSTFTSFLYKQYHSVSTIRADNRTGWTAVKWLHRLVFIVHMSKISDKTDRCLLNYNNLFGVRFSSEQWTQCILKIAGISFRESLCSNSCNLLGAVLLGWKLAVLF